MGADTAITTVLSAPAPCLCDESVRRHLKTRSLWARDGSEELGKGSEEAQEETEELIP